MLYETLKAVHVLSIVVWVGGMAFAHFFLRPALAELEPPQRLRLMHGVLRRFFQAVLGVSLLALGTGVWMLGRVARQVVQSGGNFQMPLGWTLMAVLGTLMVAIFMVIRFRFFRRFDEAIGAADWAAGAASLARIRTWVAVNLALGVFVTLVAFTG
jgi:uncharacterized membrane protein